MTKKPYSDKRWTEPVWFTPSKRKAEDDPSKWTEERRQHEQSFQDGLAELRKKAAEQRKNKKKSDDQ